MYLLGIISYLKMFNNISLIIDRDGLFIFYKITCVRNQLHTIFHNIMLFSYTLGYTYKHFLIMDPVQLTTLFKLVKNNQIFDF